ncbi:hypothetical protein [Georgenia sp. AZ-5]|uniref:hypothetical protein n=1 Tax=Georgenia sp. AZ-5 TaxID=3367526 RepID=UPI00375458BD
MSKRDGNLWLHGYEAGLMAGWQRGYDACDFKWSEHWRGISALAHDLARHPHFDDLCDIRGEHDKAEAVRADQRRRGLK